MNTVVSPTMSPLTRVGILAGAAVMALAAVPAVASAASITLGPNAPADGTRLVPPAGKVPVAIDYAVDVVGCVSPTVSVAVNGPRDFPVTPVPVVAPTGTITVNFTRPAGLDPEEYAWSALLNCQGLPAIPSEQRTVTLDPRLGHARVQGPFVVEMTRKKTKKQWSAPFTLVFTPSCSSGACTSVRDDDGDTWRYNPTKRTHLMRTKSRAACDGDRGTVSGGIVETYTFIVRAPKTAISRSQRRARSLAGTWTYVQTLTPKGTRAGCFVFKTDGRVSAKLKGKLPK